jgi:hypothetical protein
MLNDIKMRLIYISADGDDRTQASEIELFFFMFVQNVKKYQH